MIRLEHDFYSDDECTIDITTDNYALYMELLTMIQERVNKAIGDEHAAATEAYR